MGLSFLLQVYILRLGYDFCEKFDKVNCPSSFEKFFINQSSGNVSSSSDQIPSKFSGNFHNKLANLLDSSSLNSKMGIQKILAAAAWKLDDHVVSDQFLINILKEISGLSEGIITFDIQKRHYGQKIVLDKLVS